MSIDFLVFSQWLAYGQFNICLNRTKKMDTRVRHWKVHGRHLRTSDGACYIF